MPAPRRLAVATAAIAAAVLVACSSQDGRVLPPPDPSTTTTTSAPSLDAPSTGQGASELALYSTAFAGGDELPARHTCAGEDLSPPLDWVGTPPAAELAIVVRDLDAGGFVHWVVTGIDPTVHGFGEGGVPEGAVEARNGFSDVGWGGPCPPEGEVHTYELTIHALSEPLVIEPGAPADEAAAQVEAQSSAQASLRATARR